MRKAAIGIAIALLVLVTGGELVYRWMQPEPEPPPKPERRDLAAGGLNQAVTHLVEATVRKQRNFPLGERTDESAMNKESRTKGSAANGQLAASIPSASSRAIKWEDSYSEDAH